MRRFLLILMSLSILSITACANFDFSRQTVQQGNLIPQRKIARLHIGMSKQDVAILMGNTLLSPTFNNDRWDYAYTWRRGNSSTLVKNLTLYFHNDRLARIEHHP